MSSYGPQEATTADVVSAVADAELVTRNGGNYGAAWGGSAQATSNNQWRSGGPPGPALCDPLGTAGRALPQAQPRTRCRTLRPAAASSRPARRSQQRTCDAPGQRNQKARPTVTAGAQADTGAAPRHLADTLSRRGLPK